MELGSLDLIQLFDHFFPLYGSAEN